MIPIERLVNQRYVDILRPPKISAEPFRAFPTRINRRALRSRAVKRALGCAAGVGESGDMLCHANQSGLRGSGVSPPTKRLVGSRATLVKVFSLIDFMALGLSPSVPAHRKTRFRFMARRVPVDPLQPSNIISNSGNLPPHGIRGISIAILVFPALGKAPHISFISGLSLESAYVRPSTRCLSMQEAMLKPNLFSQQLLLRNHYRRRRSSLFENTI